MKHLEHKITFTLDLFIKKFLSGFEITKITTSDGEVKQITLYYDKK